MKLKWPIIAATAVLAGTVLFQALRHATPGASQTTPVEAPPVTVSVATAARRDLPILVRASGRAEAKASVTVKSRVDGQVAAILFTEGGLVHKGQLLLRMDPAPAEAHFGKRRRCSPGMKPNLRG